MGDGAGPLGTPAEGKNKQGKSPLLLGGMIPARERMRGAGSTTPLDDGGASRSSTTAVARKQELYAAADLPYCGSRYVRSIWRRAQLVGKRDLTATARLSSLRL